MRFLPHIVAVVALTLAGLFLYRLGLSRATLTCQAAETARAVDQVKEVVKVSQQQEDIDHATRKLPDAAVDVELRDLGFLRD